MSYGQGRVQVVWNRVIPPDTSSLSLDNLAGTYPAGNSGLEGGVDWHGDRVFAGAVLTTLLGVGAEPAAPENRQNGDRVIKAGRNSLQDSVNQAGQEMTRRNMNIQPALTERPGLPVRVIVNRIWYCGRISRCSSIGLLRNEHDAQTAAGAATQDREHQVDLCVPGRTQGQLRPGRYAMPHAQTYGETVDAATLIPHMLEVFMARDRGFKKVAVFKAMAQKPPQRETKPLRQSHGPTRSLRLRVGVWELSHWDGTAPQQCNISCRV